MARDVEVVEHQAVVGGPADAVGPGREWDEEIVRTLQMAAHPREQHRCADGSVVAELGEPGIGGGPARGPCPRACPPRWSSTWPTPDAGRSRSRPAAAARPTTGPAAGARAGRRGTGRCSA